MSLKLSQHSTTSLRDVLLQVSAKVIPGLRQQVVLLHCPIQKQPSRPGLSLLPHHRQASCHCKLSRVDPREQLSLCPAAALGSYQPRDHAAQSGPGLCFKAIQNDLNDINNTLVVEMGKKKN